MAACGCFFAQLWGNWWPVGMGAQATCTAAALQAAPLSPGACRCHTQQLLLLLSVGVHQIQHEHVVHRAGQHVAAARHTGTRCLHLPRNMMLWQLTCVATTPATNRRCVGGVAGNLTQQLLAPARAARGHLLEMFAPAPRIAPTHYGVRPGCSLPPAAVTAAGLVVVAGCWQLPAGHTGL